MRITDLLDARSISLQAAPGNKEEALNQAVELMTQRGNISDKAAYRRQVGKREKESTTGIGEGIAIPHGKCAAVSAPGLAAMVIPGGVDFDSLDGEPVTLLFLIAAPDTEDNIHLDVLGKLSMLLMDEEFTQRLRGANSVEEFIKIIDEADEEKAGIEERLETAGETKKSSEGSVKILAVTSCPTGIAHTYMAAEGLEKAAKGKNCTIKIETRGSGGAKNVLTEQEIKEADCIIVAADAKVPMTRYNGHTGEEEQDTKNEAKGGIAHQIYTQLLNGVSHMLPFVVGGGILIAIAFLIDGLCVDVGALTAEQRSNFGTITQAAALFKGIGGVAFGFMLPVLAGYIGKAIGDRQGMADGNVGGLVAAEGRSR